MANFSLLAKLGLDTKAFAKGLSTAKQGTNRFVSDVGSQLKGLAATFLGFRLVKSILTMGTAAAETASKFRAVFGPAADEMVKRIEELRKVIPSTTGEMQEALATYAQMGKAFGLNEKAANEFSIGMVKLAGDLASFHNLRTEEAFEKLRSAISGEFVPMKALGIVINETRLKQEALNLEIWNGTGMLNAAQKAIAVHAILIKDMGAAHGDAAETANSAANKIKFLQKNLADNATEIGVTVLPALTQLTDWAAGFISLITKATEGLGTFFGKLSLGVRMGEFEELAKQQLKNEGAFEGKGHFGRGDMIRQRAAEIEAQILQEQRAAEVRAKIEETQHRMRLRQAGVIPSEDAHGLDPEREKVMMARLQSLSSLIDAAGNLSGIANPLNRATQKESALNVIAEGRDLLKAAKMASGPGTTFDRIQTGTGEQFRKFVNGRLVGEFTADQIQTGLAAKLGKGGEKAETLLGEINETLKGKFVSE